MNTPLHTMPSKLKISIFSGETVARAERKALECVWRKGDYSKFTTNLQAALASENDSQI
jgi:hypothetical protein